MYLNNALRFLLLPSRPNGVSDSSYNHQLKEWYSLGTMPSAESFLDLSLHLAKDNIAMHQGGPFGAVLVWYPDEMGTQVPEIIGMGTNHVTTKDDPTAHAEIEALRQTAREHRHLHDGKLVLYSSSECCPMCLGMAKSAGVSDIFYVNDRHQAALIGFSDEAQYSILQHSLDRLMIPLHTLSDDKQHYYEKILGTSQAVLLKSKTECARCEVEPSMDLLTTSSMVVIQTACNLTKNVWLGSEYSLISRKKLHLSALMACDWARILRDPDCMHQDEPIYDKEARGEHRVIYVEEEVEKITALLKIPENDTSIYRTEDIKLLNAGKQLFAQWAQGVKVGEHEAY
ncbi:MAG: nucleoside deaminase [Alphaproteobacteria bacterium]|nr:nucleoside deaminase [Alphaproteobacteria bacterium]